MTERHTTTPSPALPSSRRCQDPPRPHHLRRIPRWLPPASPSSLPNPTKSHRLTKIRPSLPIHPSSPVALGETNRLAPIAARCHAPTASVHAIAGAEIPPAGSPVVSPHYTDRGSQRKTVPRATSSSPATSMPRPPHPPDLSTEIQPPRRNLLLLRPRIPPPSRSGSPIEIEPAFQRISAKSRRILPDLHPTGRLPRRDFISPVSLLHLHSTPPHPSPPAITAIPATSPVRLAIHDLHHRLQPPHHHLRPPLPSLGDCKRRPVQIHAKDLRA